MGSEPRAPLEPLFLFCALVLRQHSNRLCIERDHPSTSFALRWPNSNGVRDFDYALDNGELLSLEIKVAPAESKHFTPAHA